MMREILKMAVVRECKFDPDKRVEVSQSEVNLENAKFDPDKRIEISCERKLEPLAPEDKEKLRAETGWSSETVDAMRSKQEAEIYKNAGLKEVSVNDRVCLVREINLNEKDSFGRTNAERMKAGVPPLENGKPVELHHIGQRMDSPLAELSRDEHRGKRNDVVLHDKTKESEIDRGEFKDEREAHWKNRYETLQNRS